MTQVRSALFYQKIAINNETARVEHGRATQRGYLNKKRAAYKRLRKVGLYVLYRGDAPFPGREPREMTGFEASKENKKMRDDFYRRYTEGSKARLWEWRAK